MGSKCAREGLVTCAPRPRAQALCLRGQGGGAWVGVGGIGGLQMGSRCTREILKLRTASRLPAWGPQGSHAQQARVHKCNEGCWYGRLLVLSCAVAGLTMPACTRLGNPCAQVSIAAAAAARMHSTSRALAGRRLRRRPLKLSQKLPTPTGLQAPPGQERTGSWGRGSPPTHLTAPPAAGAP